MDNLEQHIINLVRDNLKVKENSINIEIDDNRFWIDVLDDSYRDNIENGDPIMEQYVLVPVSKIQDRLDIILRK